MSFGVCRAMGLSIGDRDAEGVSVRVGEDPQRLVGIIGAVIAGSASEREHSLVNSVEFLQVTDHQVQVQLLGDVVLGPGCGCEFGDLLEREQRRLIRQPEVEPVMPGFVVLAGWRFLVPRPIHEAKELTPTPLPDVRPWCQQQPASASASPRPWADDSDGSVAWPPSAEQLVRPPGDTAAVNNGERDEDGFPVANADNDGSVYVDEFEVAWVCECDHDLGYIWRSLGPVHRPPT